MQTLQSTYYYECMEASTMFSWGIQKGCVFELS